MTHHLCLNPRPVRCRLELRPAGDAPAGIVGLLLTLTRRMIYYGTDGRARLGDVSSAVKAVRNAPANPGFDIEIRQSDVITDQFERILLGGLTAPPLVPGLSLLPLPWSSEQPSFESWRVTPREVS